VAQGLHPALDAELGGGVRGAGFQTHRAGQRDGDDVPGALLAYHAM
jgi:hypothetical protein